MKLAAAIRSSLAAAGLALLLPASARAVPFDPCMYRVDFPVTITDPTVGGLRNGFLLHSYGNGGDLVWPAGAHLDENGNGLVEDFFPKNFCTNPPLQGFYIGIAGDPWQDIGSWDPTNPSATHHVVMLASQQVTSLLTDGRDFAELFLEDEDVVLNHLFYGTTVQCDFNTQVGLGCEGINFIDAFANRLRTGPNAIGPNTDDPCGPEPDGTPGCPIYDTRNAWFNIPAPGATPTGYDVVQFSSGTAIGSGVVSLSAVPLAAVPEPGTWALMLTGLAGVGEMARRRRRQG
jgi:hypothetical protein